MDQQLNSPKFSVIVTVFNLEKFISLSLESILSQTYNNFEIIVVDDSSTDNSKNIIESFGDKVRYFRNQENKGVFLSTVLGMLKAKGDIIAFLDGDDIWEATKLEEIVKFFNKYPKVTAISHNYDYIDQNNHELYKADNSQQELINLSNNYAPDKINAVMSDSILTYKGFVWLGSAYCFKKSILDFEKFDTWVKSLSNSTLIYQDHPIATYITVNCNAYWGYINKILFHYRLHLNNFSGAAFSLDKAISTVKRGYLTRFTTINLIRNSNEKYKYALMSQEKSIKEYEYLAELYKGNIIRSLKLFVYCFKNFWPITITVKEAFRLFSVMTLGPNKFFFFKKKLTQL